jgi:hypothetical protein
MGTKDEYSHVLKGNQPVDNKGKELHSCNFPVEVYGNGVSSIYTGSGILVLDSMFIGFKVTNGTYYFTDASGDPLVSPYNKTTVIGPNVTRPWQLGSRGMVRFNKLVLYKGLKIVVANAAAFTGQIYANVQPA